MHRKYHFIGIGGIGMSGLAQILLKKQQMISGSDVSQKPTIEHLENLGAKVFFQHHEKNIQKDMTVVYSSAVDETNPEYAQAKHFNCPILHRSDLLNLLLEDKQALLVTGTHGKTTTSALLASVLIEASLDPSYAIGGFLVKEKNNAYLGQGDYFVAEADESDGTHVTYRSFGAIMTNLDLDHLDYYETETKLEEGFSLFADQVASKQHLFWCGDCDRLSRLDIEGISYGFKNQCELQASDFRQQHWKSLFTVTFEGKVYKDIILNLPGRHNVLNALGVFGLCLRLGISEEVIRRAFLKFQSVTRRLEILDEVHHTLIIDDYAHHPSAVAAMLKSLREAVGERKLICVFQPHRYSRIKLLIDAFASCFDDSDELIITDVYAAGEAESGLNHERLLNAIDQVSAIPKYYVAKDQLVPFLSDSLRPHDVIVTVGAGDITKVGHELLLVLKNRQPNKWRVGVIAGGQSQEHEISLSTVKFFNEGLNSELYDVTKIGITNQGRWVSHDKVFDHSKVISDHLDANISNEIFKAIQACDFFIPVLHGPYGEDGMLQGFLETLGKPFIACDRNAASLVMNKAWTKKIMQHENIAVTPFLDFSELEWKQSKQCCLEAIRNDLAFPLIVKPVHLGSSIGVIKVEDIRLLDQAIDEVFELDHRVLIEEEVKGRELEISVLGDRVVEVSPPGEVVIQTEAYTYQAKYGSNPIQKKVEATLSDDLRVQAEVLAKKAYQVSGCSVLARIDFFIDENNRLLFNEINPMPGCGPKSLYHKMWLNHGYSSFTLLDRLVIAGLSQHRRVLRKNKHSLKKIAKQVVPHVFK